MYEYLHSGCRMLRTGWFFAFVLLALPNCMLQTGGYCEEAGTCPDPPKCEGPECPDPKPPVKEFEPGDDATSAIMCDIPKPLGEGEVSCATQAEADDLSNISLTEAATALANGESKTFALDWSDGAKAACGGLPKKIEFFGAFPQGLTVCLNCGTKIPAVYATPAKACIAKCKDLINFGGGPIPDVGTNAYCEANAKTATNFDKDTCYPGTCSNGGTPLPPGSFTDPRLTPELVKWIDHIGTTGVVDPVANTNTLTRIAPTTGADVPDFNAGAASAQVVKSGDGWIEFSAAENGLHHVVAVRTSCDDPINCPDTDPGFLSIGFAINLHNNDTVYVLHGDGTPNLTYEGPFGTYSVGERYRLKFTDNHDGTAALTFARVVGACQPGTVCTEDVFPTAAVSAAYPLRVDSTLQQQGATITNATLVRIQQ
jgi:hypothetical protein